MECAVEDSKLVPGADGGHVAERVAAELFTATRLRGSGCDTATSPSSTLPIIPPIQYRLVWVKSMTTIVTVVAKCRRDSNAPATSTAAGFG